jgi:hypothetical protein
MLDTAEYALVTSSLHYNDSLDTWTVVQMTAAKVKPLIYSFSAVINVSSVFVDIINIQNTLDMLSVGKWDSQYGKLAYGCKTLLRNKLRTTASMDLSPTKLLPCFHK